MEGKKDRDILLDVLKGFGIFLVVFAHTCKGGLGVKSAIYLFHMPLFFVLSGFALSYSTKKDKVGVIGYLKSLIIPYFAFSFLTYAYWAGIEWKLRPSKIPALYEGIIGTLDIRTQEFLNIFTAYPVNGSFEYNAVMWFLPCLFVDMVMYKWIKLRTGRFADWCVLGIAVLYFVSCSYLPVLPWCVGIAMVALPFVWVGDIFYAKVKSNTGMGGVFLSAIIIIATLVLYHPHVNMKSLYFGPWWLFYLVALSFIYLCVKLCQVVSLYEFGILQWLGRNSLIIMCLHEPIKRVVLKIISILSGYDIIVLRSSVIVSFVIASLVVLIPNGKPFPTA